MAAVCGVRVDRCDMEYDTRWVFDANSMREITQLPVSNHIKASRIVRFCCQRCLRHTGCQAWNLDEKQRTCTLLRRRGGATWDANNGRVKRADFTSGIAVA